MIATPIFKSEIGNLKIGEQNSAYRLALKLQGISSSEKVLFEYTSRRALTVRVLFASV